MLTYADRHVPHTLFAAAQKDRSGRGRGGGRLSVEEQEQKLEKIAEKYQLTAKVGRLCMTPFVPCPVPDDVEDADDDMTWQQRRARERKITARRRKIEAEERRERDWEEYKRQEEKSAFVEFKAGLRPSNTNQNDEPKLSLDAVLRGRDVAMPVIDAMPDDDDENEDEEDDLADSSGTGGKGGKKGGSKRTTRTKLRTERTKRTKRGKGGKGGKGQRDQDPDTLSSEYVETLMGLGKNVSVTIYARRLADDKVAKLVSVQLDGASGGDEYDEYGYEEEQIPSSCELPFRAHPLYVPWFSELGHHGGRQCVWSEAGDSPEYSVNMLVDATDRMRPRVKGMNLVLGQRSSLGDTHTDSYMQASDLYSILRNECLDWL